MDLKSFFSLKRTHAYENMLRMHIINSIFFLVVGLAIEFLGSKFFGIPAKSFKFYFDFYAYGTVYLVFLYSLFYNISFTPVSGDQSLGTPFLHYKIPPKSEDKI